MLNLKEGEVYYVTREGKLETAKYHGLVFRDRPMLIFSFTDNLLIEISIDRISPNSLLAIEDEDED